MSDPILDEMAEELREALIDSGADPKNPPQDHDMPAHRAFQEYQRRGGKLYTDKDDFVLELVKKVSSG